MPRVLAFAIEPADAFVGLLRLKAVAEASRWPPELSKVFRASVEAEFRRAEDTVRTVGLCYADLEESGVAEVNRTPQSRFDDIDGALHLCACGVSIALDLDHLRVAFDRGDQVALDSASGLATSLRSALWYLVHTELFVCSRMTLAGREIPPERALDFVENYLASAWQGAPLAPPPAPHPEDPSSGSNTGRHDAGILSSLTRTPPPRAVPQSVLDDHAQSEAPTAPPAPLSVIPDVTFPALSPFTSLSEDARYFLFQADIREKDWPVHRATLMAARRTVLRRLHPETAAPHGPPMYGAAERGAAEVLQLLATQEAGQADATSRADAGATVQIRATDLLSDDARYFLEQSGLVWPGDAPRLDAARAALSEVAAGDLDRIGRLERAYQELKRIAAR